MPIVITDEDAARLLSIEEAVEAMRVAFRDLAEGRAANPPRLRYSVMSPDPQRRYLANIHAGAVLSYGTACVRAGSHFTLVDKEAERKVFDNPEPVNWSVVILYDLKTGEPLAFMHETYLSGFRVGATTGLAVAQCAREDAEVLGLFGTGNQAFPNCRAICAVRPICRVKVFSTSAENRAAFLTRMANEDVEVIAVDDPREVVRGADIICCATNSKVPVLRGEWLEAGQMVISIANSDTLSVCHEVDAETFTRARDIIVTDWEAVTANRQVELLDHIERGTVKRERVHELGDIVAGRSSVRQERDGILYYKNNTGLAIQFAACGTILHRKLTAKGTNRTIPREWFASQKYGIG